MTTIGRAVLRDALLPASTRRRWMKPLTQTGYPGSTVGAPWEIYSYLLNSRVVDLYTKAGNTAGYASMLALSPDHEVGFTIMSANAQTSNAALQYSVGYLSDMISGVILPTLEASAKTEAKYKYEGVYRSKTGNSSIIVKSDSEPGLNVTQWVFHGKDTFKALGDIMGNVNSVRLYPTGLEKFKSNELSFRAIIQDLAPAKGIGPFTRSCKSWETINQAFYGNVGLDEFVFTLDDDGNGKTLTPRAWREELTRVK